MDSDEIGDDAVCTNCNASGTRLSGGDCEIETLNGSVDAMVADRKKFGRKDV